ncbi:MAG: aspartate aminotransferase family protein [Planctomycetes bacterium]|nr:aspartate aminotransferase family protein [Planctomycetota bacterium]
MNQDYDVPIWSGATPDEVKADLQQLLSFQDEGMSLDELSVLMEKTLIPHLVRYDLPQFNSLYNCFPEPGALLGGQIALQYNQGITNWQVSPGGVMTEEMCCQALCRMFGLGSDADATFMYCGTYANQQALYMALHWYAEQKGFDLAEKGLKGFADPSRLAVVISRDAHFSLKHAVRMMGLGEEAIIAIPVDESRRMDEQQLQQIVAKVRKTRNIFSIVSTAGTTSTGSIDPIIPVIDLCREIKAWSHIDAAYGLAFKLLPEREKLFAGIELADSVIWDPHKQLGVPIPNSVIFARRSEDLYRMAIYGEYFNRRDDPEPNPGFKSPPSTRPMQALPLVTSIRHRGLIKVIEDLRTVSQAVTTVAEQCADQPDIEICHRPDTGLLCIRVVPEGFPTDQLDKLQLYIYETIKNQCRRSISMTRLDGKVVLRLVAITPQVTGESMMETIEHIRQLAWEYQS